MRTGRLRFFVLGLLLGGCGTAEDSGDSLPAWTIDPGPLVSIGEVSGSEEYLFQSVRTARLLPDGRVAVADAGLAVVRVYDASGTHVVTMGGQGEGPGEFGFLRGMWVVAPDTIAVWDSGLYRLVYFDGAGNHLRTVPLDLTGAGGGVGSLDFLVGGRTPDGAFIASIGAPPGRVGSDVISVESFGADGSHRGRVLETTGLVRARFNDLTAPVPLSPFPWIVADGGEIYRLDPWAPRVHVGAGETAAVRSLPVAPRDPVEAWARFRARLEEQGRPPFVDVAPTLSPPDSMPSLSGLLIDDEGSLWTRPYDPAVDALWLGNAERPFGGTWSIMDPDGSLLATASLPADLAPLQIEGDRLLGVSVDALGVERVRVHRLTR